MEASREDKEECSSQNPVKFHCSAMSSKNWCQHCTHSGFVGIQMCSGFRSQDSLLFYQYLLAPCVICPSVFWSVLWSFVDALGFELFRSTLVTLLS